MSERIWTWSATEDPSGKKWRHGRAKVAFRGRGRRWKYGSPDTNPRYGERGDLGIDGEWKFLRRGHGVGFEVSWGTNGSETTPDIGLFLGPLASLWLQFEHVIPYRWLERKKPDGTDDYETRVFGLRLVDGRLRWQCWAPKNSWSAKDPKWMQGSVDLLKPLRLVHKEAVVEDSGTCVIPMLESNYAAVYAIERRTYARTGRLGALIDRITGQKVRYTTEITPGLPIPIPGKGENSWDCEDDHIHAITRPGRSVPDAVGAFVASVLSTRERYGGQHMNIPK